MPACQDPTGAFWGTPVLLGSLLYLTSVSHPCWYCTVHTLHCEPCPVSYTSLAVGLSANARDRVQTYMTFVLEACD